MQDSEKSKEELLAELGQLRNRLAECEGRQAEAEQQRDRQARIMLDRMYGFVGLLAPDGTMLDVNQTALDAAGVRREETVGLPFWQTAWWTGLPEAQAQLQAAVVRAASGEFVRYEVEVFGQAGGAGLIAIDFSLTPVTGEDGRVVYLVPEARNVTDRKQAEAEVAHKNAQLRSLYERLKELDRLKTDFFANVSHELRTPLTLILGPVQNLLACAGLEAECREDLQLIQRNARILLRQVNDLLDIAKLEAGRMVLDYSEAELADLVRLNAAHFESLAEERGIALSVHAPDKLAAQVDVEKLERVLFNLLANALKFTPAGGRVRLVLKTAGETATVTVEDSGPGVPRYLRRSIFRRFFQAKSAEHAQGGTGLGLAIVKAFVELHGGRVSVGDTPGGGATFCFEVPLTAPVGSTVRPPLENPVAEVWPRADKPTGADPGLWEKLNRPLVLVVEDNPEMNRFICRSLNAKYQVVSAFDGREGVEQAVALRPDLILTDVMMPRLNGDEMVREVRLQPGLAAVPVLVLTARADDALRVGMLRDRVQDYLMKPFSVEELCARVDNLLDARRERQRLERELDGRGEDIEQLTGELAHSEARFRDTFEQAEVGVAHVGLDGRWLRVNPCFCRIAGYSRAELLERTFLDITHPEDRQLHEEPTLRLLKGELPSHAMEKRYLHKDGAVVWVNLCVSLVRGPREEPLYFVAAAQDITDRKRVEERLQALSLRLMEAQETERHRIAYQLHDEVGQALTAVKIDLRVIENALERGGPLPDLGGCIEVVEEALARVRTLSLDLRPPMLDDLGLAAAARGYVDRQLRNAGIRWEFEAEDFDARMPMAMETACFRIVQEAITNVLRHAQAQSVYVGLHRLNGCLSLVVRDDGVGFDPEAARARAVRGGSMGLLGMEERAALAGGRIEISPAQPRGTQIQVLLPLGAKEGGR